MVAKLFKSKFKIGDLVETKNKDNPLAPIIFFKVTELEKHPMHGVMVCGNKGCFKESLLKKTRKSIYIKT